MFNHSSPHIKVKGAHHEHADASGLVRRDVKSLQTLVSDYLGGKAQTRSIPKFHFHALSVGVRS